MKEKGTNTLIFKISIGFFILAGILFLFGVDVFTYQGQINELYKQIGMISFISWLPVLKIGFILLVIYLIKKNYKKHPTINKNMSGWHDQASISFAELVFRPR